MVQLLYLCRIIAVFQNYLSVCNIPEKRMTLIYALQVPFIMVGIKLQKTTINKVCFVYSGNKFKFRIAFSVLLAATFTHLIFQKHIVC